MGARPWELVLAPLGEQCWDEATELASMIADDHYPVVLSENVRLRLAAYCVVALVTDPDYRRCLEVLLAKVEPVAGEVSDG